MNPNNRAVQKSMKFKKERERKSASSFCHAKSLFPFVFFPYRNNRDLVLYESYLQYAELSPTPTFSINYLQMSLKFSLMYPRTSVSEMSNYLDTLHV